MSKYFKALALIVILALLFNSCVFFTENKDGTELSNDRIKAVWINYEELSNLVKGQDEDAFRVKADCLMKSLSELGLNRVIVHVRAFSDSFYKSALFPESKYIKERNGDYDVLSVMTLCAHKYSLKIDAWVNPYRVSYDSDITHLDTSCPAYKFLQSDNEKNGVFLIDNGIFYNPASTLSQKLILDGIREIIDNYEVDGIHFDDYFYPSPDRNIDTADYNGYIKNGGTLNQDDWRRENVNTLISEVHTLVKAKNEKLLFTVSPSGDIEKNYSEYYADVKLWCSQDGYVDVIMPQIYYGFENGAHPFKKCVDEWMDIVNTDCVDICIGLAFYKCGKTDIYAGVGKDEWTKNNDIIKRQLEYINCGFSLYSYSSFLCEDINQTAKKELKHAKEELLK